MELCERSVNIAMLFLGVRAQRLLPVWCAGAHPAGRFVPFPLPRPLQENATEYAWDHMKRASVDIHDVTDRGLVLRYKAAFAQIQDSQHKFLEATKRYYELAQFEDVEDAELLEALSKAVRCVVLAPAGPQRQRAMGMLYQDSRTSALSSFPILEAMYMGRFVSQEVAAVFEKTLLNHHRKVRHEDQMTLLQYALIEHNVLAASNLYHNISFKSLGALLGVSTERVRPCRVFFLLLVFLGCRLRLSCVCVFCPISPPVSIQAERIATKMISEDRIQGVVDQLEGVLEFSREAEQLLSWDDQIEHVCLEVNKVAEAIVRRFPALRP